MPERKESKIGPEREASKPEEQKEKRIEDVAKATGEGPASDQEEKE